MSRKPCYNIPPQLQMHPNCEMSLSRACADGSGKLIEMFPAGKLWNPQSPQLSNTWARKFLIGRLKKRLLECRCYDPVGDASDSGNTYYSTFGCEPEVNPNDCDRLCFLVDFPDFEAAFEGGLHTFDGETDIRFVFQQTKCTINNSAFCDFDPNVIRVQLFIEDDEALETEIFDSSTSYCPYFDQTFTPDASQQRFFFLFTLADTSTVRHYIEFTSDDWEVTGTIQVGETTFTQVCFGGGTFATTCDFCTTFTGSSPTNDYLVGEIKTLGSGSYLSIEEDEVTLQFAFKPFICRFDDNSIAAFATRYCGASFNLLLLPLADYLDDDYTNSVTIFESEEDPETCNCEVFGVNVEDAGSYVIVFEDLNTGFKCLLTFTFQTSQVDNLTFSSIARDCLEVQENYYLACLELAPETCTETPVVFAILPIYQDEGAMVVVNDYLTCVEGEPCGEEIGYDLITKELIVGGAPATYEVYVPE